MKKLIPIICFLAILCSFPHTAYAPSGLPVGRARPQAEEVDGSPTGYYWKWIFGNGTITENVGGTATFDFWSSIGGSLIPSADDTYDIGSSTYQWKDGYFDGTVYTDGLTLSEDEYISWVPAATATETFHWDSVTHDFRLSDDLYLEDVHPGLVFSNINAAIGYSFHYHHGTTYPFALWRGTIDTNGGFIGGGFPLMYFDASDDAYFPLGDVYVGNDLNVEGTLTGTGSSIFADITGDSLIIDTDTLVANVSGYEDKVGIGTATPAEKLQVVGNIRITGTPNDPVLYFQSVNSGIWFDNSENKLRFAVGAGIDRLTINGLDGNIGIGTTAPSAALDLNDQDIDDVGDIALDTITSDAGTTIVMNDDVHIGADNLAENLVINDAGILQMYDSSNDTSISLQVSTNGSDNLNLTGDFVVSGDIDIDGDGLTSNGDLLITPGDTEVHIDGGLCIGGTTAIGDNNLDVIGTTSLDGDVTLDGDININGDNINCDGVLTINATSTTSFNDENITNVGDIALDSISPDGDTILMNMTASAEYMQINQSSATGTEDQPLIFINDDRSAAQMNEREEATVVIDTVAAYALYILDGKSAFEDSLYIVDDTSIRQGSTGNFVYYWSTNAAADDLFAIITAPNASNSDAIYISHDAPNGMTDHDNYLSPTFVLANDGGADTADYAGVVIGERAQADVAVAHYFDFYAMTGASDGSVDATTTEIPADFRFGSSDNADILVIDTSAGYVGIGTTVPGQLLHLYGDDLIVEDDTPWYGGFDSDTSDGWIWHINTDAASAPWQGLTLRRVDGTATNPTVTDILMHFDLSNDVYFPTGDVYVDNDLTITGILTGTLTGNAATATALAANGANAAAGNAILGVDASGAAEGAFDVWTETENTNAGYISATLTEEEVEDYVGTMLGGTETRITVGYVDGGVGAGSIDFVVTDMLNLITCPDANATAGTAITFAEAGIMAITEAADTITFTATEAQSFSDVCTIGADYAGTITVNGVTLAADELITLGGQTITYETASADFNFGDDINISDTDPHIQLIPTAGDAFELYAYGSELYYTNVTDSKVLWKINQSNQIQFYNRHGYIFPDAAPTDNYILKYDNALGRLNWEADADTGGAPTDATYITQTADGTLSAEQNLDALAAGILYSNGSGVVSKATADQIETDLTNSNMEFGTGVVTAAGFTISADENITLGSSTIQEDSGSNDVVIDNDLLLEQATPYFGWRDTDTNTGFIAHLDESAGAAPFQGWGFWDVSYSNSVYSLATTTPVIHIDTSNNITFPTADFTVKSANNANMFFVDYSDDEIHIGGTAGVDTVNIHGDVDLIHTSTEADDHALEVEVDAAGFGDVKAIEVEYDTGAISAGEDEAVILININEIDAAGGDVFGLEVLATDGSANIYGMKAGAVVAPILQQAGSFDNPTTATDNTTGPADVDAMKDGDIGTTTVIFQNDNEYILIGAAAPFTEIEFIITSGYGKSGIKPTFGYSISGAHTFTAFTPVDGTNGFRNEGAFVVAWDAADLSNHTTNNNTGTYDILITRTANPSGSVTLGYAKTATTTVYEWDENGDLNPIRDIYLEGSTGDAFEQKISTIDPTADRTFNFPNDQMVAGDVLVASDTSDLEYLNLATTEILIGDGSGVPTAASLSSDVTMDNTGAVTIADSVTVDSWTSTTAFDTDELNLSDGEFIEWGGDENITFNATSTDFIATDDWILKDANPHYDLWDTTTNTGISMHFDNAAGAQQFGFFRGTFDANGTFSNVTPFMTFDTSDNATINAGDLAVFGNITGTNLSGTNTGDDTIDTGAADAVLATAGKMHLNQADDQLSFHWGGEGEISGEASISGLRHLVIPIDPSAYYDQETTYRVLPLFQVGPDSPEGVTIVKWRANYVAGDPTTELDADLCYDTTPDFNPGAGMTVMDVIDTTAGASTATSGFDSATAPFGSEVYIRFGADPTDANVVIIFDLWFYNEED